MKKFALIGSPIEHSFSPRIHQEFASLCGIDLTYELLPTTAGTLADRILQLRELDYQGVNVTQPLKQAVLSHVSSHSDAVRLSGSANTLTFEADGNIRADNTDGEGFYQSFMKHLCATLFNKRVLLIGAGGAARGILPAILRMQPSCCYLLNRSVARRDAILAQSSSLYPHQGETVDWVINATTLQAEQLPEAFPGLPLAGVCYYDLNYHGESRNNGFYMLLEQAAAAFMIWHGVFPDTIRANVLLKNAP